MCAERPATRKFPAGFSLIEVIVFIVIVGVALAGVVSVLNLTVSHSADPMLSRQAIAVGEAFIDEILTRSFGNAAGTNVDPRSNFTGVDDYNNYASTGIKFRNGTGISGLTQYSVQVSVAPTGAPLGPGGNQVPAGQMKLVTVTVTAPNGTIYPITAYKANY